MTDSMPYRPRPFRHLRAEGVGSGDGPTDGAVDLGGEMARRAAAQAAHARMRDVFARRAESDRAALAHRARAYESAKAAFLESRGPGTRPSRADLAELAALEMQRVELARFTQLARRTAQANDLHLQMRATMDALAEAGWDMRRGATQALRDDGGTRFEATANRLAVLGAEAALDDAREAVDAAATKAGNAALTAGLDGPALFAVQDDGSIDFDADALERPPAEARGTAQIDRLAEILSMRNGLMPVAGALAQANAMREIYLANHPVVAGTVALPF